MTAVKCRKEDKEVSSGHNEMFIFFLVTAGEKQLIYLIFLYSFACCYKFCFSFCFYPFDAGHTIKGWLSFHGCQAHYCLFEPHCELKVAIRTSADNLNTPTACVIYRRAF